MELGCRHLEHLALERLFPYATRFPRESRLPHGMRALQRLVQLVVRIAPARSVCSELRRQTVMAHCMHLYVEESAAEIYDHSMLTPNRRRRKTSPHHGHGAALGDCMHWNGHRETPETSHPLNFSSYARARFDHTWIGEGRYSCSCQQICIQLRPKSAKLNAAGLASCTPTGQARCQCTDSWILMCSVCMHACGCGDQRGPRNPSLPSKACGQQDVSMIITLAWSTVLYLRQPHVTYITHEINNSNYNEPVGIP